VFLSGCDTFAGSGVRGLLGAYLGFIAERRGTTAMTTTIGIDCHKASRIAVGVDSFEVVLDEFRFRSCSSQAARLCDWADGFRNDRTASETHRSSAADVPSIRRTEWGGYRAAELTDWLGCR
jgi:hypothetical protein